jgi:hypothetical protein
MAISSSSFAKLPRLPHAWYGDTIKLFLATNPDLILGSLSKHSEFTVLLTQRDAWQDQVRHLKSQLNGLSGWIFFEFNIPRMGRRIDVVLVINGIVVVVEYKVGEEIFDRADINQVWDYALDLKNFHEGSHQLPIVPVLVATGASSSPAPQLRAAEDSVYHPLTCHPAAFRSLLAQCLERIPQAQIHGATWAAAPYKPTPTIIEAARALYSQHSVEDIARSDAGARNLALTSERIEGLLELARSDRRKIICFVTGVPGAGKTLVGLNVATKRRDEDSPTHAVFLSGNGPLVVVLHEALAQDELQRQVEIHKQQEGKQRKPQIGRIRSSVKAFIQNVHHFRDEALRNERPPNDHVAIFDEAQRAWNRSQTETFMLRKKGIPGFAQSEPEFLISYMDRHQDWAFIVCLVGGGQEINVGEAGIEEWITAVHSHFPHWQMCISPRLADSEYGTGQSLLAAAQSGSAKFDECLHLSVSMRSFRAEKVSAFVKAILDCDTEAAQEHLADISRRYPIVLTRDIELARDWTRQSARGTERYGLLASSSAQRLKPHAIDIRVAVDPKHWFLKGPEDTRSSYYLEDAATEFQVQGLEVDWACVTWDADFRYTENDWSYHDFRGDKWTNIHKADRRRYLKNAYRVLLTRARQGMVIFVPPGNRSDPTRPPEYYDQTYAYLRDIGLPELA